jgi:uncharacterized protein YqgC (DUF456 family)
MLIGLLGLIVPIFPGLIVMWLAALGYGIVSGFETLGIVVFVVQTLLMLFGSLADNLFLAGGARRGGASWWAIVIALIAGIAGTLIFPPIGGIIAAPLAILLIEYIRLGELDKAWRALRGMVTGFGLAYLIRLGIGILMMLLWWFWVWKG